MTWTRAAIAASVQARRDRVSEQLASGKLWCSAHDDGAGAWLPIGDFGSAPRRATGKQGRCRKCHAAAQKARYASDPQLREATRARLAARRAEARAASAAETAQQAAQARQAAFAAIVAGEDCWMFRDLITVDDIPQLARLRAARIRAQVEAEQAREAQAEQSRRGRVPPPPDPRSAAHPGTHPRGWVRR